MEPITHRYDFVLVFDVTNGNREVPITRYDTRQGADAHGWCFANRVAQRPTDTLTTGAALIYINGGYISLNNTGTANDTLGAAINDIKDGDVWMAVGYKLNRTAAYYNKFHVTAKPAVEMKDSTYKLNVKVVPNPYIIFNEWELSSDNRRIKFTHLPMTCKIRVFTLAGELVKVLDHKDDPARPLDEGGTRTWDLLNDNFQLIASGVYVYHVDSDVGQFTGKFAFIH